MVSDRGLWGPGGAFWGKAVMRAKSSVSRGVVVGVLFGAAAGALTLGETAQAGSVLRLRSGEVALGTKVAEKADASRRLFQEEGRLSARRVIRVVQLSRTWTEADSVAFAKAGLQLLRYLPDDAWVVRGTEHALLETSAALDSDARLGELAPEWKVSPELLSVGAPEVTVWVQLYPGVDSSRVELGLRQIASGAVRGQGRAWSVTLAPGQLGALAAVDGVEWIQEAPLLVTFDYQPQDESSPTETPQAPPALTGYESGTRIMGFDAAWERGFLGQGQTVAVADTGVDSGDRATLHPDLKDGLVSGKAIGLGGSSWKDPQGHGTHVAGSVMGRGTASNGAITGGAKGAGLVALGMWSDLLNNLAPPFDVEGLFGPAYTAGARIHTNSWGNPRAMGEYDSLASRVDEYLWKNPEMMVLFAAGNSGEDANQDGRIDPGSVTSPATSKNCLSVGASENLLLEGGIQKKLSELRDGARKWGAGPLKDDKLSDNENGLAAFSSRGPTKDGRIKPEVVAPGTNIVSTRSRVSGASALWGEYDASYVYSGGTSMSTPLVAGAAAVVRQALVQSKGIAQPTGALVKATLIHSAFDLFPGQYGTGEGQELPTPRPNVHEGFGRVDVAQATALSNVTVVDERTGVAGGEVWTTSLRVRETRTRSGASIRATLSYTDAPGSPGAAATLVNDLDLELVDASGKVIAAKADRVNNTEMLELSGVAPGEYKLQVRGVRVAQGKNGKQPFALVMSR
jgi:serine protease AprX